MPIVTVVRFGQFEANLSTGELFRDGRRARLQHQPFEVLRVLLEKPGALVTRDDLRRRLWPDGITVEFDHSLNKCVAKLRDALGDSATNPRFIETLPKRGYRFLAPVVVEPFGIATEMNAAAAAAPPSSDAADATFEGVEHLSAPPVVVARSGSPTARLGRLRRPLGLWVAAACALMVVVAAGLTLVSGKANARGAAANAGPRVPGASRPIYAARDAHDRARVALSRRTPDALTSAVEQFERAVMLSPRYAEAHVGLAEAWSLLASYGLTDPREGMPRARAAATHALALDPSLARAHATLARTAMVFDWDWRTASWHFARALELEGGDATTRQWHAYFLSALGRHDEAIAEARRAVAAEPLSLNANTALGLVLYLARRYDESVDQLTRTLAIDPEFAQARRDLGLALVMQGRLSEAVAALRRAWTINEQSPTARAELAWAHALAGDVASARAALKQLEERRTRTFVPPDAIALIYSGLGRQDDAAAWLQRAFDMRLASLAHLPVDPMWDDARKHPRVRELVERIRGQ
jgi:DNA-binding winged helix-turn-helix (wHTH) protein/tetratricopeptide (TPR) repeat protein